MAGGASVHITIDTMDVETGIRDCSMHTEISYYILVAP